MIYSVTGRPWLMYRIGDTVTTKDGVTGKVVKRHKLSGRSRPLVDLEQEDGTIATCPEHHICKSSLNDIPWRRE